MTKKPEIKSNIDVPAQDDLTAITNKYHQVLDEVKAADDLANAEHGCFVVPSDEDHPDCRAAARKALEDRMTVRLARVDTFAFSEEDMERIAKERQAAREAYSRTRKETKKEPKKEKAGLWGRTKKPVVIPESAVADRMEEPAFSFLEEEVRYDDYAEKPSEKEALLDQLFSGNAEKEAAPQSLQDSSPEQSLPLEEDSAVIAPEQSLPPEKDHCPVEVSLSEGGGPADRRESAVEKPLEEPDRRLDQFMDGVLGRVGSGFRAVGAALSKVLRPAGRLVGTGFAFAAAPFAKGFLALKKKWAPPINKKIALAEDFFAAKVTAADEKIDIAMDRTKAFGLAAWNGWNGFRRFSDKYKGVYIGVFACVVIFLSVVSFNNGSSIAYEYRYNGNLLGVVKDPRVVEEVVDLVGDRLGQVYDAEITLKKNNISFTEIRDKDAVIDGPEEILTALTYMKDLDALAYAICVNGEQKAVLESREAAEEILDAIKTEYTPQIEGVQYLSIGFAEDVSIAEVSVRLKNVEDKEQVMEEMMTSGVEQIFYTVASGDTFSAIAKKHEISMDELQSLNPDVDPAKIYVGDQLVMNRQVPQITVQTKEIAVYNENVPYDITYEDTGSMYQGETKVKSAGIYGKREVTAEIVRNNGVEVGRTELGERLLSEPTSQVVLRGTKEIPPLIGTGSFQYPARGRLSSKFGARWGRQHEGIDIAAPVGTDVRAADGGKVIYSGWAGALGYCVKIDHGGNMTTVYGHCSKLLVSVGDRVYKDQLIAKMGSTGRSTGSHVHFEIRKNGVAQNPLKYL
ncbi:MAG: peptidoglycan DD-metalloendopeptidase family protein [Firmicutes bacterium]|nr:peptidoglycan DD-metalloendopeptidase family protein [Bacillota bacterium]